MNDKFALKNDDLITVCAECLQASCWHGEFMCEDAANANIIQKTVKELRELKKNNNWWEHEYHWTKQLIQEEKCFEELTGSLNPKEFKEQCKN